jgi:DNA repair exonuclease SbcCD ATPase subunit
MNLEEMIDLRTAAEVAKVHRTTIFRALQQGKVQGERIQVGGQKAVFYLHRASFENWLVERAQIDAQLHSVHAQGCAHRSVHDCADAQEPVHIGLIELMKTLQQQFEEERSRVERERLRAEMAERSRLELELRLRQYQTALSEQAETLMEERTMRKVTEAQIETQRPDFEKLAEENLRLKEQFELEKSALTEKLKTSQSRVEWLEKRVPRWVRSIFRAG